MLERIGARIRAKRNSLGLSLEALANKVGISKMTLQRIETGSTSPSIIILTDISFHLKQPIETLIKEGEPRMVLLKKMHRTQFSTRKAGLGSWLPKGYRLSTDICETAHLENGVVYLGSFSCPGCGLTIAFRHVVKTLGKNTAVITTAGCGSVVAGYYPATTSNLPFFHHRNVYQVDAAIAEGLNLKTTSFPIVNTAIGSKID